MKLFKMNNAKKILPTIIKTAAVIGTGTIIHNAIMATTPKSTSLFKLGCILTAEWFIADIATDTVYDKVTEAIEEFTN